ncbi:MAG: DUF748 domain-containing protein [Candidatus Omnitrophica bacterium]|nr:DUF748 domain-containing protein [Candidatus Omnitrophota bacterium]
MFIPKAIEQECSKVFGVPVRIGKAGVNFLNTSFWMRDFEMTNVTGMEARTFLSFKHLSINFSLTSLLARQLIFERIRFQDLVLNLERDQNGQLNLDYFQGQIQKRFKPKIKFGKRHFFTGYEIHQFSIKNGIFRYANRTIPEEVKRWMFRNIDLSFSNFAYPPQFVDPIPTSLYLNAKIDGIREGSVLILGTGNLFAGKKEFRIRSDLKNIRLRDLNPFFYDFPLFFTDGFLNLKSVTNSKDDWLTVTNEAFAEDIRFSEKPGFSKVKTVLGFPKKDIFELFEIMNGRPFHFDFSMSGDLEDPSFRLDEIFKQKFSEAIERQLEKAFQKLNQNALGADAQTRGNSAKPQASLKQLIQQWTGIKFSGE